MKVCPNCQNEHVGEFKRCGYCLAVTEPNHRQQDTSTDDAINEYRHDQQEQGDGGWVE